MRSTYDVNETIRRSVSKQILIHMNTEKFQRFTPDPKWREHNGALFVVAHPDDEVLIGWQVMQTLVSAGIPVTVLLLTLGEHGKFDGQTVTPGALKETRRAEFMDAAVNLGVRGVVYEPLFPDGGLADTQHDVDEAVTRFVRAGQYDVLFSFAPGERTYAFDHRDHHAVAAATVKASETADMPTVYPDAPPLSYRPGLMGWTTNPHIGARHQLFEIPLSDKDMKKRGDFLREHYPSQFSQRSRGFWEPIFERVSRGDTKRSHRQLFFQIR